MIWHLTYAQVKCSCTEFAEVPSSVIVELGMVPPPLRCRHMSLEAIIVWRVNNSSVGQFPDIRSGSVYESGSIVHTLTIPAEPQYNGTEVVCVAVFIDGLTPVEVTPAATIIFTPTNSPDPTTVPGITCHIFYKRINSNNINYSRF